MGIGSIVSKVTGFLAGPSGGAALELAKQGTEGLISGIDKLVYTDQEKAEFSKERAQIALQMSAMHIKLMETIGDENTARSIARRRLAFMITLVFLFLILFSAMVWKFDKSWSDAVFDRVKSMDTLMVSVVVFYFGYYGVKNIISTAKGNG